jgi:hypothetical protein
VEIVVDEGTSWVYPIAVMDEDDNNFKYALSTSWSGITVSTDGGISVDAVKGDVGQFSATLLVEDASGAFDTWDISITVLNVNDPPTILDILDPTNHTIVDQGVNVTFSVRVDDPDVMFGQVLSVTWLSNISGPFMTRTSQEELTFLKDDLPVGVHTITVRLSDGEHVRESWVILEVVEPYVPPPPKKDEPFLQTTSGMGAVIAIVLAVVIVALFLVTRSRRKEEVEEEIPPSTPPEDQDIVMDVVEGSQRYEIAAMGEEFGKLADELEASKGTEGATPVIEPEPPASPELEEVVAPSEEELADRAHAGEVRDVMEALTQLPRGLPVSLIDYELTALALKIVDGPKKKLPDGTTLVEIDGKWYTADHTRTSTFLQLHHEPSESPGLATVDRVKKLEQLEARLLEGKISEETYDRLRKKYEDE